LNSVLKILQYCTYIWFLFSEVTDC